MAASSYTPEQLRRARMGVGVIFLCNGAAWATLLPRLPELKGELGLTNSDFGLALAAFPAGALVAGAFAAILIRRFGSSLIAWIGMIASMIALVGAAASPAYWVFLATACLAGCADSITDVAQNHHALRVQKLMKRSIINSYHAMWSVGALVGAGVAPGAIAQHLHRVVHLVIMCASLLIMSTIGWRSMLAGPEPSETVDDPGDGTLNPVWKKMSPVMVVVLLSIMAIAGVVIEDSPGSWSTVYMRNELDVAPSLAPLGYVFGMAFHFLGRVSGDPLVNRYGQRAMALVGGVLAIIGMGVAIAWPTMITTIMGYSLASYGVATIIPSIFEAADILPGFKPGTALMIVSLVLRVGYIATPLVVGLIADATAIRWGLLVVPMSGLVVAMLAWMLSPRKQSASVPVPTP